MLLGQQKDGDGSEAGAASMQLLLKIDLLMTHGVQNQQANMTLKEPIRA